MFTSRNQEIDALTVKVNDADILIETLTAKMNEMDDLIQTLTTKVKEMDDKMLNNTDLDHRIDMSYNGDKWVSVKNTIQYTLNVTYGDNDVLNPGRIPHGDDPSRVVGLTNLKMLSMSHNSQYSGMFNKISNKSVELLYLGHDCNIPDLSKFPSLLAIHLHDNMTIQAPTIICQLQLGRHKVNQITIVNCPGVYQTQSLMDTYCKANGIEFIYYASDMGGIMVGQVWKKRFDWF
jgi:hypothetical protein